MPSGDQVRAMQARVKNVPVAKISSYARDAAKIQANPGAYQWLKDASPSAFNALMNVNK